MSQTVLTQAVEAFARVGVKYSDAKLENEWKWGDYEEGVRFSFFLTYQELREVAAQTMSCACHRFSGKTTRWRSGSACTASMLTCGSTRSRWKRHWQVSITTHVRPSGWCVCSTGRWARLKAR